MSPESQITEALKLGDIYLPSGTGTPVGRFEFLVDRESGVHVEVGTPVAADTREGVVVGVVDDMRTVGHAKDPFTFDMLGASSTQTLDIRSEVVLASVQVFYSEAMRPVRAGTVRPASANEMAEATGADRMDWCVPAGVIELAGGKFAPVFLDGAALLGPESAHLTIGGLSGQAAKTSFAGVLLKSAIHAGGDEHKVAALIFNVKGTDLIYIDEKPTAGFELTEDDEAIYKALGIPSTPFDDVTVYAPSLPGGAGTRSPRDEVVELRWDLVMIWRYLKYFWPWMYEDDKVRGFLDQFEDQLLYSKANPINTFGKLHAWFSSQIEEAEENKNEYCWNGRVHLATMRRLRRMFGSLVSEGQGLLSQEGSKAGQDVPDTGWSQGQVVVVDIAGLTPKVQGVVIARTCERLLRTAEDQKLGVDHLIVLADELNAFAPSMGGEMASVRKILQKIATQGRYAGISLWGAAQKLSKVDELVRDNAATRALGITADAEISSGTYGRLPGGLSERIATLPKGRMALWHYAYRAALVVRFPRPAWRTGKAKTSGGGRKDALSILNLSQRSASRITEGIDADEVERIVAHADDPQAARVALMDARVPDPKVTMLTPADRTFDPENPFDLPDA